MTRTLYDGITAADVPDGWAVAGYIDGNWPDYTALTLRWPGAVHISIAASAADRAKVLDVETGDATPQDAPGWVLDQRAAGDPYPWVYCNDSTWPEVIFEFTAQHVPAPLWWIALYDGIAVLAPNQIAKQHTNTPGYDISVVADHVPGIDPAPQPAAPAASPEEDEMSKTSINGRAGDSWGAGNPPRCHVVQISGDPGVIGDATFRVVVNIGQPEGAGPLVLAEAATIPHTGATSFQIPPQFLADATSCYVYCSNPNVPFELVTV